MRAAISATLLAIAAYFAAGAMFDAITNPSLVGGAILTGATISKASTAAKNFSIIRFACQLLISAGVGAGTFYLKKR
ncbi:hypothetical protein D6825_00585 [Candidatus Woesearchaeota archaeon]|nr:MAG: hypothetical protein D6825_00585 [Candidatus Woesearchaeota archaeon]